MRAAALSKSWRRPLPVPPNGSLTPFLFQTRTILQPSARPSKPSYKEDPTAKGLARHSPSALKSLGIDPVKGASLKGSRHERSSPSSKRNPRKAPNLNDVPFEGTDLHEHQRPQRFTITRAEKEAFARLFNMVIGPSGEYKAKTAREGKSEGAVTDAVEGETAERKRVEMQDEDFPEHFPAPLKRMAAEASRKVQEKEEEARLARELEAQEADKVARELEEAKRMASDPLYQQQVAQKDRIEALLSAANTDVELWNTLETELFTPTQLLGLDIQHVNTDERALITSNRQAEVPVEQVDSSQYASALATEPGVSFLKKSKRKSKLLDGMESLPSPGFSPSEESTREHNIAIITYIYPIVLRTALDHLTKSFPASSLPFSILPRIKRLGRTSYILGASTPLYNSIIYLTWKKYADFHRIDELLQEFDPCGLEFDSRTLEILEGIAREGERGRRGRDGINSKLVWNMDIVTGGWRKVVEWIPTVRDRLEQEAIRRSEEAVRKAKEAHQEQYSNHLE